VSEVAHLKVSDIDSARMTPATIRADAGVERGRLELCVAEQHLDHAKYRRPVRASGSFAVDQDVAEIDAEAIENALRRGVEPSASPGRYATESGQKIAFTLNGSLSATPAETFAGARRLMEAHVQLREALGLATSPFLPTVAVY
jgi:hypothetical protein